MIYELFLLYVLVFAAQPAFAFPGVIGNLGWRAKLANRWPRSASSNGLHNLATNPNGSTFLWLPEDEYSGKTFFDDVFLILFGSYVNKTYAFENGLAYVNDDGTVGMKGDNTTWLPEGTNRSSVRISSNAQYNTGLFILDLNRAPWGCGVWPAFCNSIHASTCMKTYTIRQGQVCLFEGVHDNEHNQVTWHTGPGCLLTLESNYTGTVVESNNAPNLNCDGNIPGNAGCGITEWSKASYGPFFEAQGGGVFAMKWDETGIAVYSFYRSAIPHDITSGSPNPANWGVPVASLAPEACDPLTYFVNHSIIFELTRLPGDWAGNSYATSGCPGSCATRLMDPSNFVNASWSINSLKVYKKQTIIGSVSSNAVLRVPIQWAFIFVIFGISMA
ncbi:glycoside hydrolase family 16 protein [Mycena vitilis]|nr:glycoside hydrolase family 16 protein [Mycena vitilis]